MLASIRQRARVIKRDILALYLAARHSRTPWYAKVLAIAIAGYALSPIDLIPDFIPVLGYLDDAILLPAAIIVCIRLIPADVLAECRAQAATDFADGKPISRTAAAIIIAVWVASLCLVCLWLWRFWTYKR